MQVNASIDEADIGRVHAGQDVTFRVDAYPNETFTGRVEQVRLQPITVQNVVTYNTLIAVDNPGGRLMPGMTATVSRDRPEARGRAAPARGRAAVPARRVGSRAGRRGGAGGAAAGGPRRRRGWAGGGAPPAGGAAAATAAAASAPAAGGGRTRRQDAADPAAGGRGGQGGWARRRRRRRPGRRHAPLVFVPGADGKPKPAAASARASPTASASRS